MVNTSMFQKSLEQKEIQIQTVKCFNLFLSFFLFTLGMDLGLTFIIEQLQLQLQYQILFCSFSFY